MIYINDGLYCVNVIWLLCNEMCAVCKEIYKCKDMKLFSICRKKQLFLRKKIDFGLCGRDKIRAAEQVPPLSLVVHPGLEPRLADPESDVLPLHQWTRSFRMGR